MKMSAYTVKNIVLYQVDLTTQHRSNVKRKYCFESKGLKLNIKLPLAFKVDNFHVGTNRKTHLDLKLAFYSVSP